MGKYETLADGVMSRKHPTRKHGIKPDQYFKIRFQYNNKRTDSGLGWASEGWTLQKVIKRRQELIEHAHKTGMVKTHRQLMVEDQATFAKAEKEKEEAEKQKITVEKFYFETFKPLLEKEFEFSTYSRHLSNFENWIMPGLKGLAFDEVEKDHFNSILYNAFDSGLSVRSVEYIYITLTKLWKYASDFELFTGKTPVISEGLKNRLRKNNNSRFRFLTKDEAFLLLKELKKRSQNVYEQALMSLYCGLRTAEVLNLRWKNIDLQHSIINLTKTKGDKSRTTYITKNIKDILEKKEIGKNDDLVFPSRTGEVSPRISRVFSEVADELFNKNVTDARQKVVFHTLRHTYASWLVMEGISLYAVQKLLGHSDIKTTMRYAHLAPDYLQRSASVLEQFSFQI